MVSRYIQAQELLMTQERWSKVLRQIPCSATREQLDRLWSGADGSSKAGVDSLARWAQLRTAIDNASKATGTKQHFIRAPHVVKEIVLARMYFNFHFISKKNNVISKQSLLLKICILDSIRQYRVA